MLCYSNCNTPRIGFPVWKIHRVWPHSFLHFCSIAAVLCVSWRTNIPSPDIFSLENTAFLFTSSFSPLQFIEITLRLISVLYEISFCHSCHCLIAMYLMKYFFHINFTGAHNIWTDSYFTLNISHQIDITSNSFLNKMVNWAGDDWIPVYCQSYCSSRQWRRAEVHTAGRRWATYCVFFF